MDTSIFEKRESGVRSYCRNFPAVFAKAKMSKLYDESGRGYIDFFAGSGALNYGHNNEYIKQRVIEYMQQDNVTHALDMYTQAKRDFLIEFEKRILAPKGLDYRIQFCGPTGTNAVESALKLVRKAKHNPLVFAFTGSYHGMSMGSASVTGSVSGRLNIGTATTGVAFMPYPFGYFETFDTLGYMEEMIRDKNSGVGMPAAVLVETVQCDGGICVAEIEWLKRLRALCDKYGIIMIVDDVQAGCGRCGDFFSFERAGIVPDIVTLSKSISGNGYPMSVLLMRPEFDVWSPGEQTGTFRGFQPAFVGAKAALEYRDETDMDAATKKKSRLVSDFLRSEIICLHENIDVRGIGLIYGIDLKGAQLSKQVLDKCFEKGLIIERVGRSDEVLKLLPPLVIDEEELIQGLEIIRDSIKECL